MEERPKPAGKWPLSFGTCLTSALLPSLGAGRGGAELRVARGQPPTAPVLPGHRFQNGSPERDLEKAVRSGWISGLSGV